MGLFDGVLGGQGGLGGLANSATTTSNTTTNPAQQAAAWNTAHTPLTNHPQQWAQNALTPYGETLELKKEVAELRYILQRVVENYDELLEQHKALQDITKAGENK